MKGSFKLSIFIILFLGIIFSVKSQNYHEKEKEVLRTILRQSGDRETNFNKLGLSVSDTLNWYTSEAWLSKLHNVKWNNLRPSRLTEMNWNIYTKSLKEIDFSDFEYLEVLKLIDNNVIPHISSVIINNNYKLKTLSLSYFQMGDELEITNCINLDTLYLHGCRIRKLDVSKNLKLKYLYCSIENVIQNIDLSNNVELEYLNLTYNHDLSNLNVRNCKKLKYLNMYFNATGIIESVDLSQNTELTYFNCGNSKLKKLDFSTNNKLDTIICSSNRLVELTLPKIPKLRYLECSFNKLSNIDLSTCSELVSLSTSANLLGSIDVTKNKKLETLYCGYIGLEKLDISQNVLLNKLDCSENKMRFSTLPLPKFSFYEYRVQDTIRGGTIDYDAIIDLSEEYLINGKTTSYKWSLNNTSIDLIKVGNGKFRIPVQYSGQTLSCEMTNETFPELVQYYKVKSTFSPLPSGIYHEGEKEALRAILRQCDNIPAGLDGQYVNFISLGLTESDTVSWYTSEAWVEKLAGLKWKDNVTPKRLSEIIWPMDGYKKGGLHVQEGKSIDFSVFELLEKVRCSYVGSFSSSDRAPIVFHKNTELKTISLKGFSIDEDGFTKNTNVDSLIMSSCLVKNWDLSKNSKLKYFYSMENYIGKLDLSKNTELIRLECPTNYSFKELDIRNCSKLKYVNIGKMSSEADDGITELDLSTNRELTYLDCHAHRITKLDVSQNHKLDTLRCDNNQLTELIFSSTPSLTDLNCNFNKLKSLDISKQTNLISLGIIMNEGFSGSLDLKKHTKLKYLYCNGITEIDLSQCTELEDFASYYSTFSAIDFSNNPKLKGIEMSMTEVDSIILPKENNLDKVYLVNNKLKLSTLPLPLPQYTQYTYSPQDTITIENVIPTSILDLSSEAVIGGKKTVYSWYMNGMPISIPSLEDGKFEMPVAYSGNELECILKNETFPELIQVYKVNILQQDIAHYDSGDLIALKDFLNQEGKSGKKNYEHWGLTLKDIQVWDIETLNNLKHVIWGTDVPKRIEKIDGGPNLGGKLDCSPFTELKSLVCMGSEFSLINISNNKKLEQFGCAYVENLDFSNNPELMDIGIYNGTFDEIDLSVNNKLKVIELVDNNVSKIIFPNENILEYLYLTDNNLKFSTLPLPSDQYKGYIYYPQRAILDTIPLHQAIDLSGESVIDGKETIYKWFLDKKEIKLEQGENGKFKISEIYAGKDLVCKMTNPAFPLLTLEYNVKVLDATLDIYHQDDVEGLKTFLSQSKGNAKSTGKNYSCFEITDKEMTNWDINTLIKVTGVQWTSNYPKRIESIDWGKKGIGGVLDCSNFESLIKLECDDNSIVQLELAQNKDLQILSCANNDLEELHLSKNVSLEVILCQSNNISVLTVPSSVKLLNCASNELTFNSMPEVDPDVFEYEVQAPIDGGTVGVGELIDLSKDYNVKNKITVYEWYNGTQKVTLENKGNGKFAAGKELEGKNLVCKMVNGSFPGLTLQYNVTVSGTSGIEDEKSRLSVQLLNNIVDYGTPITILNHTGSIVKGKIYNMKGVLVKELNILDSSLNVYLDTSGLYILHLTMSDNQQVVFKVIIR
ncbi:MAG: hypothetical protein E6772_09310 [Dysgonomonas sp.]|nr:hypothetical protein [Dysgonomonas sp.]